MSMARIAARQQHHQSNILYHHVCNAFKGNQLLTLDEKLDLQCITIYNQSNVVINMVICDISATVNETLIFTMV